MSQRQPKIRQRHFDPDANGQEFADICARLAKPLKDFIDHPYVPELHADQISDWVSDVVNFVSLAETNGEYAASQLRFLSAQFGRKKEE